MTFNKQIVEYDTMPAINVKSPSHGDTKAWAKKYHPCLRQCFCGKISIKSKRKFGNKSNQIKDL